jgi:hypothetical protein
METKSQMSDASQSSPEKRITFDQYVEQLPVPKQSAHRWVIWLVAAGIILTLGVFVYAIYTSITWKTAGGQNVVLSWMYFFLSGAIAAFLLGLDTILIGATIPLPFERSKYDFTKGHGAVREGWWLVGYGVVVTILVIAGVTAVKAGTLSIEDWITYFVSIFVILGLGSGALAILRRILRSRNS